MYLKNLYSCLIRALTWVVKGSDITTKSQTCYNTYEGKLWEYFGNRKDVPYEYRCGVSYSNGDLLSKWQGSAVVEFHK